MASTMKSVDVEVPISSVYNQWTQFEEFPKFMEGVHEVRQVNDKTLVWRAKVGGKEEEWKATISEQIPDERVAWRSIDGASNAGVVTFHYLDDMKTRVTLQMEYDPEGFVEKAGDMLGFVDRRISGDLDRFKEFIEGQGGESGAWRGKFERN